MISSIENDINLDLQQQVNYVAYKNCLDQIDTHFMLKLAAEHDPTNVRNVFSFREEKLFCDARNAVSSAKTC